MWEIRHSDHELPRGGAGRGGPEHEAVSRLNCAVADTSALIALAACGGLELLDRMYSKVRVPATVRDEPLVGGKPMFELLRSYLQAKVVEVDPQSMRGFDRVIGAGEAAAIILCRQIGADRLIMDDQRGRREARSRGIAVIGSVGVLLTGKQKGWIGAVRPRLCEMLEVGIHLSPSLLPEALRLAGEDVLDLPAG